MIRRHKEKNSRFNTLQAASISLIKPAAFIDVSPAVVLWRKRSLWASAWSVLFGTDFMFHQAREQSHEWFLPLISILKRSGAAWNPWAFPKRNIKKTNLLVCHHLAWLKIFWDCLTVRGERDYDIIWEDSGGANRCRAPRCSCSCFVSKTLSSIAALFHLSTTKLLAYLSSRPASLDDMKTWRGFHFSVHSGGSSLCFLM